ncbi:hypothetical protein WA026_005396 [Henosepilachna vigintioctopunctata]|uniref:Beta-galactosidase n=1 Tax=Henosepilachna vigintioctopunctata TaxID=420089 RepID=A0AAW1U3P9_9CUCU
MSSLPTVYEYYTSGGIHSGLAASGDEFKLNNLPIAIYSGAIHYFRIHPDYWRDRLRKAKACGLNCVETYVPWNLHEPEKDFYDFGNGMKDMSLFCDIKRYLKVAQEEDLLVIVRPGPYICAEWEFGGMPSYLLREENLTFRSSDQRFLKRVEKYFNELFKILSPLQFTKGGPVIAFQIENEYGNVKEINKEIDVKYLLRLKELMEQNGVKELLFTSDTPSLGFFGTIPGVLATANFQIDAKKELQLLKDFQPDKPLMVMEFWTGWFDHWTEARQTRSLETFAIELENILERGASLNFYMFHGGTNWGFMNGANNFGEDYQADITSYDYDCLLSEAGDYTEKYFKAKELLQKYQKVATRFVEEVPLSTRITFPPESVTQMLKFEDIFKKTSYQTFEKNPIPMELIAINSNSGQSFGYIVYRKTGLNIPPNSTLKLKGKIRDQAIVLLNGQLKSQKLKSVDDLNGFGYWRSEDSFLYLNNQNMVDATLDIIVNNWGRINFGKLKDFRQHKGLYQCDLFLNDEILNDWTIKPLEFKAEWTRNLSEWRDVETVAGPAIYKAVFNTNVLKNCFIDMRDWGQGCVILNDFVLGRYCSLGPQYTMFMPAAFLKKGRNTILVFEHFEAANCIKFTSSPIWDKP